LSKLIKKNSAFIALDNRCQICDTKLTLYPKDFMECPHCHKKVCRQCWTVAWPSKTFSQENCSHLGQKDLLSTATFAQKEKNINWDWPRIIFASVLVILAIGVFMFLLNFFVF
jgi:hypothetical protein